MSADVVFDGSQLKERAYVVQLDEERILLPKHIVEGAQRSMVAGEQPVDCWLFVVTPGRFRLISQAAGGASADLARILRQIEENEVPGELRERTGNNALDGIQARLIPCKLTPPRPGWRLNFPREAKKLVSDKEDRSFVYVMVVAGYIEIWFPDALRRALSVPIAEIFP